MNKLSRFLVVAMAISSFLVAFNPRGIERHFSGRDSTYPMLKPGEKIDDMVITSGTEDAYPLSAFCSPTKENDHSIRVDCGELSVCANLAIGQTFGVTDLILVSIDRDDLTWKMSVDGHPISLEAFGVSDFVHPDLVLNPSTGRELFKAGRLWNVVLVNPTPGMHMLRVKFNLEMEPHRIPRLLTLQLQHESNMPSQTDITVLDSTEGFAKAVTADDSKKGKTLSRNLGTPISSGRTAEIYHWDREHVLKLFYDWVALESIENEARIAGTIQLGGLPIPEVGEIIHMDNRTGLIYQRVYGDSMYKTVQRKPWNAIRYLRRSAELQADIHSYTISARLLSQRQILENNIRAAARLADEIPELDGTLIEQVEKYLKIPSWAPDICHKNFFASWWFRLLALNLRVIHPTPSSPPPPETTDSPPPTRTETPRPPTPP